MSERVYTLSEAAIHLRLTNRGVAKIARRHGLCMVTGRALLFSDADIEGIKDTLRPAPTLPLRAARRADTSSHYQQLRSLMELTRKKSKRSAK